jgi:DNA-binding response OmpR family regulator
VVRGDRVRVGSGTVSNKRILVVDDEQDIRDLLENLLVAEGFDVDTAKDAHSALVSIRNQIYDVALLDFNLPDMDGVMLHRQIRQIDEELAGRSIFMSGLVQDDSSMDYYASFGGAFVAKPFDISQVIEAIETVLKPSQD